MRDWPVDIGCDIRRSWSRATWPKSGQRRCSRLKAKLKVVRSWQLKDFRNPSQFFKGTDEISLRNLLSNLHPVHFHPVAVDREDLEEYVELLRRFCASWDAPPPDVPNAF